MPQIKTYDQLIAVLSAMIANFPTYQTQIGGTPADATLINQAFAKLNYLRDYSETVDAFKKGVFQMKQTAFNGSVDEVMAPFPVVVPGEAPELLQAGYLERVNNLIRRFKLGPGYNHDIGVALGFETSDPSAPADPSTVKPRLRRSPPRPVIWPQSWSPIAPNQISGKFRRRQRQRPRIGRSSKPPPANRPTSHSRLQLRASRSSSRSAFN